MYNPAHARNTWSTIALGSLLLIAARSTGGSDRNLKSRNRLSKRSSAGASLESAVSLQIR